MSLAIALGLLLLRDRVAFVTARCFENKSLSPGFTVNAEIKEGTWRCNFAP